MLSLIWIVAFFPQMAGFNPRVVNVGFVVGKVAREQDFPQALWFSSANYHSTNTPYSSRTIILYEAAISRDSVSPNFYN
jgi:hypothetical protein